LENELEELEDRHRNLAQSYTDLDSTAAKLKQEVKQLRNELETVHGSREGSMNDELTPQSHNFYDPFPSDGVFGSGTGLGF
jgi:chromosome segregation ATPase